MVGDGERLPSCALVSQADERRHRPVPSSFFSACLAPGPLTCPLSSTDVPVEKLAAMPALRSINLRFNPLNAEVRVIAPPLIKFDMLMSPEGARAPPP